MFFFSHQNTFLMSSILVSNKQLALYSVHGSFPILVQVILSAVDSLFDIGHTHKILVIKTYCCD